MTSTSNGTTELNAAEAILAEAAAVVPADYAIPEHVPAANHKIIGDCTPLLKQLHTLATRTLQQIKPIGTEANAIGTEVAATVNGMPDIISHAEYLAQPEVVEKLHRYKELSDQVSLLQTRLYLVNGILTAEVVRLFPEVASGNYGFDTFGRVFVFLRPDQVAKEIEQIAAAQQPREQSAVEAPSPTTTMQ